MMIKYREIYPNLYLGLNYSPIDLNLINIKGEYSIGDILVVENFYKSKIMIYIIENNKALLVTNNANNYLLKEDLDILIFTKYK